MQSNNGHGHRVLLRILGGLQITQQIYLKISEVFSFAINHVNILSLKV